MSFLLWQRDGHARIGSGRLVLRAAEVPLLADAQALRDTLERLRAEQEALVAAEGARGFQQGLEQGLKAGRHEAADTVAATLTTIAQVAAQERERLRGEVGALALQVVRKLLGHFAEDSVLAALAATAANDLLATQPVTLAVHPELCQPVRDRLAGLGEGSGLRCEVRADPTAARDSCRLETEHGSVDAALQAQLARLEAAWGQVAQKEQQP
jgi:flagellar biosynthesis/type III secretory pathway protein FliH